MDHYDEALSHPSNSIPSAAYPDDSPYRPGTSSHLGGSSTASNGLTGGLNLGNSLQTHSSSTSTPSPYASTPQFVTQMGSTNQVPSPWSHDAAVASLHMLQTAPPPYDPSSAPSSYSPLDTPASSRREASSAQDSGQAIPLRHMPSSASMVSSVSTLHDHNQRQSPATQHQRRQDDADAQDDSSSLNPHASDDAALGVKLGPIAEARLKKKRRLVICALILCSFIIFFVALVVGIALGLLKARAHRHHPDHPHHHDGDKWPPSKGP